MYEKEYKEALAALKKQRKEVSTSKKAAKKLLTDLGIFHLLVPKGTQQQTATTLR